MDLVNAVYQSTHEATAESFQNISPVWLEDQLGEVSVFH
jgi:hypothetical protein